MNTHKTTFSRKEHAAILAGLRLLQRELAGDSGVDDAIAAILTDGGQHAGLHADALDGLCESINTGGIVLDAGLHSPPDTADALMHPEIEATAWPDDRPFSVSFLANHYFAHADDDDLVDLGACYWSLDYASDRVVDHAAAYDAQVRRVFVYLAITDKGGYECSVNGTQAMAWLQAHRPGVWARIICEWRGIRLAQASEGEAMECWGWIDDPNETSSATSFDTADEAALDVVRQMGDEDRAR